MHRQSESAIIVREIPKISAGPFSIACMNPISAFFVRNIVAVYFLYGLAFFALGLALWLASRRPSAFRFASAIRPLAVFGLLHGLHEWVEMFQKIAALSGGYVPGLGVEIVRTLVLAASFLYLLLFGMILLPPTQPSPRQLAPPLITLTGLWLAAAAIGALALRPPPAEIVAQADVLARYSLGIPAALLGAWALMRQQRTFREHDMPQFGRDLVWAATALLLYGVFGHLFVRQTALFPSQFLNSTLFLQWFGIPVQLFRAALAGGMAFFVMRALNAFEWENQRRLEAAAAAQAAAQEARIEAERRNRLEVEGLNEELRFTAHELALLLDVANLLVAPSSLRQRLALVLQKLVESVPSCSQGMILLIEEKQRVVDMVVDQGFAQGETGDHAQALALGQRSIDEAQAVCRHADGLILQFDPEKGRAACAGQSSPVRAIALPLIVREQAIGSLILGRAATHPHEFLTLSGYQMLLAAAQQLGLSIENAQLTMEAQKREALLGRLLHQVVEAQETERKRIARELHDATGQSLTAISLGLRGIGGLLEREGSPAVRQAQELGVMSGQALGELRQIIFDLRPSHLDDLGLIPALRWYLGQFEKRRGIHTRLEVRDGVERLPSEVETVLFRIVQEALTNIAKHAQATEALVLVRRDPEGLELQVRDNGRGFDVARSAPLAGAAGAGGGAGGGWGLLGMQERAGLLGGSILIDAAPGQGTAITVHIPLLTERNHESADSIVVGG